MISFKSFTISESVSYSDSDITYDGVKKIKSVIESLRNIQDRISDVEFGNIIKRSDELLNSISTRMIQEISANNTYKNHIKMWNNMHSGKIVNTAEYTQKLIVFVEQKLNKNIIDAKRQDVRIKRQKEKTLILSWYKKNKDDLKKLFDLKNLITDAKDIIEESNIQKEN